MFSLSGRKEHDQLEIFAENIRSVLVRAEPRANVITRV